MWWYLEDVQSWYLEDVNLQSQISSCIKRGCAIKLGTLVRDKFFSSWRDMFVKSFGRQIPPQTSQEFCNSLSHFVSRSKFYANKGRSCGCRRLSSFVLTTSFSWRCLRVFFPGILLTGVTGFVGKVLLEKLLWEFCGNNSPYAGPVIYVLVRSTRKLWYKYLSKRPGM